MLPLFETIQRSALGQWVNSNIYNFAIIESVHLVALAIIGGAVLVVDMRLLGLGLTRQPVRLIARNAQPWLIGSLILIILTGFPLFASLASDKYYGNAAFWWKMYFLIAAILFTFTVRQRIAMGDETRANSALAKVVALVSVGLWSGVGIAGRWIGFI